MLLPQRLRKGNTVGIIAPASPPDLQHLEKGVHFLESLGLNVQIGKHLNDLNGYLAGSDEDRLKDLHQMFKDPNISGIFCAGGGYGTARIASGLDYSLIANHPKVFWGYSDITYLHTAIRLYSGLVTFHGPMVCSDIGKDSFDALSAEMFQQLFEPSQLIYSQQISKLEVISPGEAIGELVGGNLTLLISSIGTPYEIDTTDKLLFIEDVGEEPYRIDAMLNQLKMSGKLDDAVGVVVGDFKHAVSSNDKPSLSLEQVLNHYLGGLNKPVVKGFQIGHCMPHFSIPLGVKAKLSSRSKQLLISPGVE